MNGRGSEHRSPQRGTSEGRGAERPAGREHQTLTTLTVARGARTPVVPAIIRYLLLIIGACALTYFAVLFALGFRPRDFMRRAK